MPTFDLEALERIIAERGDCAGPIELKDTVVSVAERRAHCAKLWEATRQ